MIEKHIVLEDIDMTTIVDGYYADASRMFIVGGKTTPEKEQLVRVAKQCLEIGMEVAKPYSFVGDIGHAIEKHCKKYGYGVVRDLCGHGVGCQFHEEPEVLIRADEKRLRVGCFYQVEITASEEFDLYGKVVK